MMPTIVLPTTLPEGTLYRFTYEGPCTTWHYAFDLRTTNKGYECHVTPRVPSGSAVEHITRDTLRDVLVHTTRAMRDITCKQSVWERNAIPDESIMAVSMRIARARCDPFGSVATRILPGRWRRASRKNHWRSAPIAAVRNTSDDLSEKRNVASAPQ